MELPHVPAPHALTRYQDAAPRASGRKGEAVGKTRCLREAVVGRQVGGEALGDVVAGGCPNRRRLAAPSNARHPCGNHFVHFHAGDFNRRRPDACFEWCAVESSPMAAEREPAPVRAGLVFAHPDASSFGLSAQGYARMPLGGRDRLSYTEQLESRPRLYCCKNRYSDSQRGRSPGRVLERLARRSRHDALSRKDVRPRQLTVHVDRISQMVGHDR